MCNWHKNQLKCIVCKLFKLHSSHCMAGVLSLHSKVQIWMFSSVKGPDRNNWLLQNLFLINIHNFFFEKIKCPLHSKYINKCKSGKTINLSVSNRGWPKRVFLWPMKIFTNQGSRWPIYDADFLADMFGRFFFFSFPLYLIKESLRKWLLQGTK